MQSELTASITKAVLSRVQHQVARPAADSYINDIKKNITEELKNIHEDIQSSISGKPRVYGNWDNRPDGVGKRIADIFRIRDERGETAKRLLQTEIIEQRLAFESIGINTRNIDTNYASVDLAEGDYDLAEISEKDKTGKQKQPTRAPRLYDYSLLLAQKTDQELVQLNKQSIEYLTYFFEASEKKTQKAEQVRVYDVTRSTAQSSMFFSSLPRVAFIPRVNADTLVFTAATATEIELGIEGALTAIYGLGKGAVALGRTVLASGPAMLPVAGFVTATSLTYRVGLDYADDVQKYSRLASNNDTTVKVTAADYALANRMNVFDLDNPYDMESLEHIARGIAIERSNQQTSLRTTELPAMDFKVMGRIDQQRHGDVLSAYFDIDPNANKSITLSTPIPYQPKSILFTPPDRALEWSKLPLPGFSPSMVKIWQEGFDVHKSDWKDSILEKRKHESSTNPQVSKFKNTSTFGMPDPGDLEPDDYGDNEHSFDPRKEENHDKIRRDESYGKLYRDAKDSKVWYSKDRGGDRAHAGEHWKQFRQYGDKLIHEADVDLTGKIINKHKSEVGRVIKLKDTIGIK